MKDLMFRYSLDAYTIQKGLHIGCVSLRFCYHKYPIKANATDAAMEQLTSCIRNNMYTFASMGEKYFQRGGITREQFRTGIREMEVPAHPVHSTSNLQCNSWSLSLLCVIVRFSEKL
ncbi:uncharacterized protein LOC135375700 isoform X1 [Ornithodoros turicata]|uniref:uncharacterized protein LOC135375700 isoform X1 n=1 Tax=Ornithodoros turicata TaxID=34597 RepID=UPI00313A3E0F